MSYGRGLVLYLTIGAVVVVSGRPMASSFVPAEPTLMIATAPIGQNLASNTTRAGNLRGRAKTRPTVRAASPGDVFMMTIRMCA